MLALMVCGDFDDGGDEWEKIMMVMNGEKVDDGGKV